MNKKKTKEATWCLEQKCTSNAHVTWIKAFCDLLFWTFFSEQYKARKNAIAVQLNSPRRGAYSNNFHFPADETSLASLHLFTPCKSHNHNSKCQGKQCSNFRSRKKLSCPQHYIFHSPWLLSNVCLAQQKKETCFLWSRPNFFFSKATCLLYSTQPEVKSAHVWLADNSNTTFTRKRQEGFVSAIL